MFVARMRERFRRLGRRNEEGQALVEMALILPFLLLVVFGIIQFGLLFYNYIDLTSATRDGGRKATVSRVSSDAPAAVRQAIRDATSIIDDAQATVTVTPGQPWRSGDTVTVRVSYPYSFDIMGVSAWSGPMTSEAVVRIE